MRAKTGEETLHHVQVCAGEEGFLAGFFKTRLRVLS